MPRTKQLTIPTQDRPGTLAQIAKLLGQSKINIVAMNCATFGMQGAIQIVVDDVARAKRVLDKQHLPYTEHDVLCLEIENSPGCLGEFAGKLAAHGINVSAGYGTAAKDSDKATLVLRVSDLEAASKIR
jgi:hypothetical protein